MKSVALASTTMKVALMALSVLLVSCKESGGAQIPPGASVEVAPNAPQAKRLRDTISTLKKAQDSKKIDYLAIKQKANDAGASDAINVVKFDIADND